jgi:hypothetical protein
MPLDISVFSGILHVETVGSEIGLPHWTPMVIFDMSMIDDVDVKWKYRNHER